MRKSVYKKVGLFNPAYILVPDYDMWLRIASQFDIGVYPEVLFNYKCFHTNLTETLTRGLRGNVECYLMLNDFIDNKENFVNTKLNDEEIKRLRDEANNQVAVSACKNAVKNSAFYGDRLSAVKLVFLALSIRCRIVLNPVFYAALLCVPFGRFSGSLVRFFYLQINKDV